MSYDDSGKDAIPRIASPREMRREADHLHERAKELHRRAAQLDNVNKVTTEPEPPREIESPWPSESGIAGQCAPVDSREALRIRIEAEENQCIARLVRLRELKIDLTMISPRSADLFFRLMDSLK